MDSSTNASSSTSSMHTYPVLALYVPSHIPIEDEKRLIKSISEANKGFIPGLQITSIEWLIPEWVDKKGYGTLLVNFTSPEHANAAIREQLFISNIVHACEFYERKARPQQCFYCQQYGHSREDCPASTPACAHCAGNHEIADCTIKNQSGVRTSRCAVCRGGHRSFDKTCPVRQSLLDDARSARANRAIYHLVNGELPYTEWWPEWEVPSREYAGRLRYSIDFLKEVEARQGRKSHARLRGRGGRGEGIPPPFKASEEQIIIERCLDCVTSPEGRPCPLDPSRR